MRISRIATLAVNVLTCLSATAQQHRPPAVPLVTNDPFFSLWSMSDRLTDAPVKHWTEVAQPITGLIRIDSKPYRWMGTIQRGYFGMAPIDAMAQSAVEITPLHTRYTLNGGGIELKVTFFTPLFPADLDVMSRPVTYLSWSARSTDGKQHQTDVMVMSIHRSRSTNLVSKSYGREHRLQVSPCSASAIGTSPHSINPETACASIGDTFILQFPIPPRQRRLCLSRRSQYLLKVGI